MIEKDLYQSRNMRQPFSKGFFFGGAMASAMAITKGAFPGGHWENEDDAEQAMCDRQAGRAATRSPTASYTFDKLSSVFLSGNATRDDAPNHVQVQTHVPREVAQAWVSMCPAQVYEIPDEQLENGAAGRRRQRHRLQLRPVRRDHGEGGPPHPPRGWRRPPVPGDVSAPVC